MCNKTQTVGRVIPGRLFSSFPFYLTALTFSLALLASGFLHTADWATWERSSPMGIQLWTAHFNHWSMGHFFWDALMFVFLAGLIEKQNRQLLVRLLLLTPPAILLAVWAFGDHLSYRGLSGLDSALYGASIVVLLQHRRLHPSIALFAGGLFLAKCVFELLSGSTFFVSDLPSGVSPVPLAHLVGILSGILVAFLVNRNGYPSGSAEAPFPD
jgi:hypothetical protein